MLSGLLITLDILVCIALIAVVLLQRSEGGAFGMGGGPTGLITTRGAGDLLTRTTWILFTLFLVLSLGLTLLGAHDRATSAVLNRLKLQTANPNELNQHPATPPGAPLNGAAPFLAPPPTGASTGAPPIPAPAPAATPPAHDATAADHASRPAAAAPTQPAPPALLAPAPAPATPAAGPSSSSSAGHPRSRPPAR